MAPFIILADQPNGPGPAGIAFIVAVFLVLGVLVLWLFRGYEKVALRSLRRRYAGLEVHETPQNGDVIIIYHTYHGFIAWVTQTPHHVVLPEADARKLLGRLLRFNLMFGLFTYGALFIPPLAIGNYVAQRRSISAQAAMTDQREEGP